MSENDSGTGFGPGFVAACIVVAAVVACGVVLLVTDSRTAPATPAPVQAVQQSTVPPVGHGGCSLPAGDQGIPSTAPAADGWEVSRRVVVPRSAAFGPGATDSDGFRRCFAHSPTGAVFAAYNVLAALADQTKVAATARKVMVPGPETDALLRDSAGEEPTDSEPTQLAGYRVLAANRDQVTVMLAVPVEQQYMSLTVTLVWHDHDWRLQPPPPGDAVGAPFVQLRGLADFVKWSGL
jgi:hypothetical protein